MPEPVVFISRNRIKDGQAVAFRLHYEASIAPVLAGKPGTYAQLAYENEDGTEVTVVRLFPSADALDQQIQGANERSRITYQMIEPVSIEIYGTPKPDTLERMQKVAGTGVSVTIHSHYIGGFIRSNCGAG